MSDLPYTYGEDLLTITDLSVVYDFPVLKNLGLVIKNVVRPGLSQGQVHGILAPSGTGKSQLFRCIAGLQKPTTGRVMIGDGDPTTPDWEVHVGEVGVVAQDYPLFEHLTVIDNLMLAATVKQKDRVQARTACMSYLERFGLSDCAKRYPKQISGGMRQRVAIIQQVVSCGHILLMDEPFSGLDPLRKESVQSLILSIASSHDLNSIILTTHDIQSAIEVCDTITLIGRDRDPGGNFIAGAKVQKSYDLIELGLAWRGGSVRDFPQYRDLEREIIAEFHNL